MRCIYFLIILLFTTGVSEAQDTLWAQYNRDDIPFLSVRSREGESIYSIAKRYSVPPGFLSDLNGRSLKERLIPATVIRIPVGSYNYRRISDPAGNRPVYYKVRENDKLPDIARAFNASPQSLQQWNHLNGSEIAAGKTLLTGWIAYDAYGTVTGAADTPAPVSFPVVRKIADKNEAPSTEDVLADSMQSMLEHHYYESHGTSALEEEAGAAVFFESNAPAKPGVYYAFHNTAERSSIIRVYNPDGGKTIYVKVIGKIPELKEYHNCIIAISDDAAKALGAPYKRTFCKISY